MRYVRKGTIRIVNGVVEKTEQIVGAEPSDDAPPDFVPGRSNHAINRYMASPVPDGGPSW